MHAIARHSPAPAVEADIGFLEPSTESLFTYAHDDPPGATSSNTRFVPHRVRIRDVRTTDALLLDVNGAELGDWPTAFRSFYDPEAVREWYYPEAAEIIGVVTGADRVVVFDHNVRRGESLAARAGLSGISHPVRHAHVDFTAQSAPLRLGRELNALGERLDCSRCVQLNLWRPIRAPLRDAPLAICDGASVSAESLRNVELRYPDRLGEIYYLTYAPSQRWYYASDMRINEAWLFKNHDSAESTGRQGLAPHSAFDDPNWPLAPPRESIEVRAFALFD